MLFWFGGRFLNITSVLKEESSFKFKSIFVIVDIIRVLYRLAAI